MCNDSKVKLLYSVCTLIWTIIHYNIIKLRGRWMLESDWLTNVLRCTIIFRETHGERSSRQLSRPHYSSVSLRQMISLISKVALQFRITSPNYFCYFKGRITVLYHFAKLFLLFQKSHYISVSLRQIISVISKVALQFCITLPNYFCYFKGLITEKLCKTHNDTGQTNKYSKQKDKIDRYCPCFCHKITFYYVRKAHSLLSLYPALGLSLTDTHIVCTHLTISANVVSTIWRLDQ